MTIASITSQTQLLATKINGGAASAPLHRVPIDDAQISSSTAAGSPRTDPGDPKLLETAVQKVQDFTQTLAKELEFNIDEDSGQTVVRIVDAVTKEVIRQIPSEEMLSIAKALDQIQGLLIKQKA